MADGQHQPKPSWAEMLLPKLNPPAALALCVALAVAGSFSYIFGIMSLAYPQHLVETRRGRPFGICANVGFFCLYGLGQAGALFLPLIGSWYGPVSVQLPVYQATMLLWNLVFISLLGMKRFAKDEMVGVIVIVVAVTMLIDAGPVEDTACSFRFSRLDRDAAGDMPTDCAAPGWYGTLTSAWLLLVALLWLASTIGMARDALGAPTPRTAQLAIYVLAQGIGTPGVTSLGKIFALVSGRDLLVAGVLFALVGATNTLSSILAAQRLDQGQFIPYASVASLLFNQLTGLLVWQDWRTIHLWASYVGIHVLVVLGLYLLSSAQAGTIEYSNVVRQDSLKRLSSPGRQYAVQHNAS